MGQEEERKIARQREVADAQHAEALKLLSVYKDRLGLAITREAPQTVRMTLSLLVESNPDREFCFTLGLTESEQTRAPMIQSRTVCLKYPSSRSCFSSSTTTLPRSTHCH